MELAVGGPGDLPFPGNPASVVLPLHVQVLRHKFALSLPRPDPSCRGQRRPLKGFRLKGFWGAGGGGVIPSFLAPQGVGDPAAAIGALPGERPSARPRFPRRGVGHGHWSCSPSPEGGLPGGWGADARCCGMMRDAGRAVVRPRSPQSPPAPCGSAEEPRSPGGVRVSDPPVLARSRTRESRRCPAVRLPPGGGGRCGGDTGGSLGKRPGRAGDAGGLRLEAARKRRCEGAMALLLLRYKTEAGAV